MNMKNIKQQFSGQDNKPKNGTIRWQQKWAGWMQRQSERLSRRSKILLWFVCCIGFGTYCSYLIIGGFSKGAVGTFSIRQIRLPFHIGKTDKPPQTIITEREYQRINAYLYYLDSLENAAGGRARFDSIQQNRPGLHDSLKMVQKLYLKQ
jgi:hypothetical protein